MNQPLAHKKRKHDLLAQCQAHVQERIDAARQAMEAAQESANSESKSSAGDKYETGRAMAQIERDRYAHQLDLALTMAQELARINVDKDYLTVQPGCLVSTNRGAFFIGISVGKLTLDGSDYFAISSVSPIGAALLGRQVGDTVLFNKLTYNVLEVV